MVGPILSGGGAGGGVSEPDQVLPEPGLQLAQELEVSRGQVWEGGGVEKILEAGAAAALPDEAQDLSRGCRRDGPFLEGVHQAAAQPEPDQRRQPEVVLCRRELGRTSLNQRTVQVLDAGLPLARGPAAEQPAQCFLAAGLAQTLFSAGGPAARGHSCQAETSSSSPKALASTSLGRLSARAAPARAPSRPPSPIQSAARQTTLP